MKEKASKCRIIKSESYLIKWWVKNLSQRHKKKRRKLFKFHYLFFGMVFVYFFIHFAPIVMSSTIETYIVQYGDIQISHRFNFYLVRNEQLIKSNSEGTIKYFVQEGEKVKKGYKVAEVYKDSVDETTRKKLEVINQRIESLDLNKDNLFEGDVEKLNETVDKLIREIKDRKDQGDLLKVEELKKDLSNKLEKKRIVVGDKSFAGKNLASLKQEQQQLEQKISSAVSGIVSPDPGIISYHIDGYETILNPSNMMKVKQEVLKELGSAVSDLRVANTIVGQPLFKVVDCNTWYLIGWIDKKYQDYYKTAKKVELRFEQGTINGEIFKLIENDDNLMLILKADEYIEDFYKNRNVDIDIIVVKYEGLKIHKTSIVEKDGKKGVYVLDVNRCATFKPVKILGYDEEHAITASNFFYEKQGEDVKTIQTIKLYDEILKNGSKIKDGQIVY